MKSSELRGTGSVFRFTLIQTVKSKAYIVSAVIMLVLALLVSPVLQLINGGSGRPSECIHCLQCEDACPQHIHITEWLEKIAATLE